MKIVTVREMRAIEQSSVELGVPLDELQRNAARAIAREIERLCGDTTGPLLFLVGPGNNGRDALIAADLLRERGRSVRAYLAPKVGSEDVLSRLREGGVPVHIEAEPADRTLLRRWIQSASVVVDGLLGIGIRGAAREPIAGMIAATNEETAAHQIPVVAVDLPSGIDADRGEVRGAAIRADYTISLGCVKAGLLKFPAAEYAGTLLPVGIGLPPGSYEAVRLELLEADGVAPLLPPRPRHAHKGTFGRVLVVAGSRNFVGAAYLTAAAAARSGAGLVTFAVPEWLRSPLATLLPEGTYLPLRDSDDLEAAETNVGIIVGALTSGSCLAIGPGLGQGPAQSRLVMGVLEAARQAGGVPAVVDADGLNALSGEAGWWERIGAGHVLTPHPGEMSRLTSLSTRAIDADRWALAREWAARWGQTVVLKGAFTVVADPGGDAWVSPTATPALASAGTGDVLTGLIAGMMAQGASPTDAARLGVFLHAAAACQVLAGEEIDRLLASDLLAAIPSAISELLARTRVRRPR